MLKALAAMGLFPRLKDVISSKPPAKLIRVISLTAGKNHAWVESDQGPIRKPLSAIPKDMMDDFRNGRG